MKFNLPEIDTTEVKSREGLHIEIFKSPDKNIGYYAAVYNKFGYQVSNTEYAYRKKTLVKLKLDDFIIE